MKLYVHVEEHDSDAASRVTTTRVTLSSALATLDDVLQACCKAHAQRKTRSADRAAARELSLADVDVFTERGQNSSTRQRLEHDTGARKQIARYLRAAAAGELDTDALDSFDFELVLVQRSTAAREAHDKASTAAMPTRTSVNTATASNAASVGRQQQQRQQDRAAPANSHATVPHAKPNPSKHTQSLQELLSLGARMMQERKYRSAAQLFESLVLPVDPDNAHALLAMGDIHAANDRFDIAVDRWYRRCWTRHGGGGCSRAAFARNGRDTSLMLECGLQLARCEVQRGRFREALAVVDQLQQQFIHRGSAHSSGAPTSSPSSSADVDAQICLVKAQALYKLHRTEPEQQDAAIALLTHLLPDLQAPTVNLDALQMYAQVAFDRGKRSEALSMLLRVLVGRSNDKDVRQQLASFVGSNTNGIALLRLAVPPGSASAAAAYAFIGTILKDYSALDASIACFELATAGNPASATYALNHAHVLEVCNKYARAFEVLLAFCRCNSTLSVAKTLHAEDVAMTLDEEIGSNLLDGVATCSPQQIDSRWRVEWIVDSDATGHANVYFDGVRTPACEQSSRSNRDAADDLTPDELDLLACFFAVVKILFLTGHVAGLPRLVSLIEPVRAGRALHRTTIRNEQAYYSCIAQLLSVSDRFAPTTAPALSSELQPQSLPMTDVYVCGDSHTLATAWREMHVQNKRVLLRPALVTGLKHWHLRRDAVFYPKANFWNVLRAIPRHSQVVFLFGEIDCREGILVAVERAKYETVEEGMEATIAIFLAALQDAVQQFAVDAYIHPVVPVLPETRSLVIAYNRIFERRVRASTICTWLDCFDDLLIADATSQPQERKLRPEFALDGTHLHPRYLDVLERALDTATTRRSSSSNSSSSVDMPN